ncbi:hypothetical protein L6164_026055 [Bauhinia variegata]|uniref:Uncharacterized protein n=1 Tax=Bauhinia variegata TaxID=167791 RepID=A0ACB9M425_BAUVA|nr:hypothetical protein L6164_026055 [Bauhinia variegata]
MSKPFWAEADEVQKEIMADPFFSDIVVAIKADPNARPGFSLVQNKLFYKGRLVVPKNSKWVPILLREFHSTPTGGHSGVIRNYKRSLLFQELLPLKFWGDAILTATFLINRLPSEVLQHKSPFELLFNTVPSNSHLRIFGCLAFALNKTLHKHKFALRSRPSVSIGYPIDIKGYKFYNSETQKVVITCDIT